MPRGMNGKRSRITSDREVGVRHVPVDVAARQTARLSNSVSTSNRKMPRVQLDALDARSGVLDLILGSSEISGRLAGEPFVNFLPWWN